MTKQNLLTKLSKKLALILALVSVLCFSVFFFTACDSEEETDSSTTTYTYADDNSGKISNSTFSYGTANLEYSSYPKTSVTGWSRAVDNSAYSSSVNSGVIDLSTNGWDTLVATLYKDEEFLAFAKSKIVDYNDDNLREKFNEFMVKPATHDGMKENNVYMLNNYLSSTKLGIGTAQAITSSSSITLEKGSYAKVSVWVMTQNISGNNADENYGANIRLTNTFNSTTQAQYRLDNIDTNGVWKQYSIYVKADDYYATTVKLVLGLGYGNGSNTSALYYTEGTVYFDDVSYEVLTEEEYISATAGKTIFGNSNLVYGSDEVIKNNAKNLTDNDYLFYDMTLNSMLNDKVAVNSYDVKGGDTVAENTGDITYSTLSLTDDYYTVNCSNAYTVKFSSDDFTVQAEDYVLLNFYVKNNLSKFGSSTISFSIIDKLNDTETKRSATETIDTISDDWQLVSLLIKNNFVGGQTRSFDILVEVGPQASELLTISEASAYANGTVYIKAPQFATGDIDVDNLTYKLFNSIATSQALYAGFSSDYSEEGSTSYNLNPSSGNVGEIVNYPTNLENYDGIVANHLYVTDDSNVSEINTRSGETGTTGLINTKYLNNYTYKTEIEQALTGAYSDDIQPLMIYNVDKDHYGFIGESNTVSANSYALVSLSVRVTGDATAYIYLVDTSSTSKKVLTFNSFNQNTDGVKYTTPTAIDGANLKFEIKVTSDMMDTDGWATISFYIATGTKEKDFRLEIWNGSRVYSEVGSKGFVFVNDISISTSSAFSEASNSLNTFNNSSSPLYNLRSSLTEKYDYKRVLTSTEEQFNSEYPDKEVSYDANYVWAKSSNLIYAVYNTLEVEETNPYDSLEDEEEETTEDTTTDAGNFWLSFSSILLAVVLVLAIIALIIKNSRIKAKANRSDAKSHYDIKSREKIAKKNNSTNVESDEEPAIENTAEETPAEQPIDETPTESAEEKPEEQKLDEYLYGDVQDFGANAETNENSLPQESGESVEATPVENTEQTETPVATENTETTENNETPTDKE